MKINNVKIKINFSFLLLCALWLYVGQITTFLTITFAVLLHEFFHIFVATLFGFHTESVELFPFGGEAKIRGIEDKYVFEAIVASAGPFISLLSAFLWEKGTIIGVLPAWGEFVAFSYSIALINLLPIYPLDGGRILCSGFKGMFGENKGRRYAVLSGVIISSGYFIKCLYEIYTIQKSDSIVMASFMLVASLKAIKKPRRIIFREKYWKNENIKIIKAYGSEKIMDVFEKFSGNNFYCILTVDENENTLGIFTEKQLYDCMLKNSQLTLNEMIIHP